LHSTATGGQPWDLREFFVEGTARSPTDPGARNTANGGSAFPRDDHFALFELGISATFSTVYGSDGQGRNRHRHAGISC